MTTDDESRDCSPEGGGDVRVTERHQTTVESGPLSLVGRKVIQFET